MDRKERLNTKLRELRKRRALLERDRLIEGIEDFGGKYRFADEAEAQSIERFIERLDFIAPGRVAVPGECASTPHQEMYLCFLAGSEELLQNYVFGNYGDLMADLEQFCCISPFLLLIDADFRRYIFIDDEGRLSESSL